MLKKTQCTENNQAFGDSNEKIDNAKEIDSKYFANKINNLQQ